MNKRRRFKAKRKRYLTKPRQQDALKAARHSALWGASLNGVMRILERNHPKAGLSRREVHNHLLKLYL